MWKCRHELVIEKNREQVAEDILLWMEAKAKNKIAFEKL